MLSFVIKNMKNILKIRIFCKARRIFWLQKTTISLSVDRDAVIEETSRNSLASLVSLIFATGSRN